MAISIIADPGFSLAVHQPFRVFSRSLVKADAQEPDGEAGFPEQPCCSNTRRGVFDQLSYGNTMKPSMSTPFPTRTSQI